MLELAMRAAREAGAILQDYAARGFQIEHKGRINLVTEANKNRPLDTLDVHDVWHPEHMPRAAGARVCDDNRHKGFIQILYVDGHVNTRMWKELKVQDFRLDRR